MMQVNAAVVGPSWRVGSVALAAALVVGIGTGRARAADTPTESDPLVKRVVEHEALVAQHVKEKAPQALLQDAKVACELHKAVATRDDLRPRVLALLEIVVKNVKDEGGRKTALEHVGSTGDLDGMKIVKPYLRQPDREKSSTVLLCAIRMAGKLPVGDSVEPLLGMVEDSKVMAVCSAAMESLGAFGKVKNKREKILTGLCKTVAKWVPSTVRKPKSTGGPSDPGYTNGGGEASQRWTALAPILPKTLNDLTGQRVNTAEEWFRVVKDTPDLGVLFRQG
jgi:hypothetical protein